MPPDGTIRFPIELGLNDSRETLCVVEWEDDLGEHGSPPTCGPRVVARRRLRISGGIREL